MTDVLDVMCPMHMIINKTGHIIHVGPTLKKVRDEWCGQRFLEVFALKRPRSITTAQELQEIIGTTLHLQFRDPPMISLKGVLVPGQVEGQMIVNLSFGISVVEAVQEFALTNADFAATDLTIEMLYLVEAKSAAMEASRQLDLRLQGAMIAAEEQAFTDSLTGLKNRRAFDFILSRQIVGGQPFALMQIDLDFFKAVNDTYGHAAGDHVLQTVSRLMNNEVREGDVVARLGGDEFAILFPGTVKQEVLEKIGTRIIAKLERPIPFQGNTCCISGSIGTAIKSAGGMQTAIQMQEDADIALYASKRAGRAQQTFFSEELKLNGMGADLSAPQPRV